MNQKGPFGYLKMASFASSLVVFVSSSATALPFHPVQRLRHERNDDFGSPQPAPPLEPIESPVPSPQPVSGPGGGTARYPRFEQYVDNHRHLGFYPRRLDRRLDGTPSCPLPGLTPQQRVLNWQGNHPNWTAAHSTKATIMRNHPRASVFGKRHL